MRPLPNFTRGLKKCPQSSVFSGPMSDKFRIIQLPPRIREDREFALLSGNMPFLSGSTYLKSGRKGTKDGEK